MGEQHPVISLPLGLRGGMDTESGDRRGKRTEEGPQHPSLCFCIWGSISYTLCLFEAPKDHIYFLTMEQVSSLGAIYSEFSLFYQIRNSPFFKESLKKNTTSPARHGSVAECLPIDQEAMVRFLAGHTSGLWAQSPRWGL